MRSQRMTIEGALPGHKWAQSCGGFVWHLVPLPIDARLSTALCGYTPTGARARWVSAKAALSYDRACQNCIRQKTAVEENKP